MYFIRLDYADMKGLPSGSRRRAIPRSLSAAENTYSRRSKFDLEFMEVISTEPGLSACSNALKAFPSRQLAPKSFTSIPYSL